ncbi:SRPBCC family protein [Prauserella cavernicola]|uniref:SRPBCC family protein n=1 Tax=Prauserella cavernicola TaxID=2800127 RepID=A0A934V370_9PSEU|nr:SRPBCC family protein [Prauserella cavernicola]MBK1786941.1 SRPBCC family protein [Prauserella cavernicola]
MRLEVVRRVDAGLEVVWAALADIESWSRWTESITSVRRLDTGPLRVGSQARVKQPRLPEQVWRVTELTESAGFTWETRGPGVTTIGGHWLTDADGAVTATLTLEQRGPLGAVLGMVLGGLSRRYVNLEADGLKRAAESS